MVAPVVLDVEVPVAGLGQGDLRQPPLQRILLVPHLVGGVDAHAAEHAHRQRHADLGRPAQSAVEAEPAQIRCGEQVGAEDDAGVLERDVDVGAVAVVLVVLEPLHQLVGRVLPVGAELQVQAGQQDVDQDRTDPERRLRRGVPAELVEPPDQRQHHEQRRGRDQTHQPQIALPVAPVLDVDRRHVLCGHSMPPCCECSHLVSLTIETVLSRVYTKQLFCKAHPGESGAFRDTSGASARRNRRADQRKDPIRISGEVQPGEPEHLPTQQDEVVLPLTIDLKGVRVAVKREPVHFDRDLLRPESDVDPITADPVVGLPPADPGIP